jgi:iron complex outermembrane receptor protein
MSTEEEEVLRMPSSRPRGRDGLYARRPGALTFALGLTICLAAETSARAAETPTLITEETFLSEVPVVLGATRLSQPLSETPAAVTVIDRRMIEASGARDITDVLRLVPGFQVGHVNGYTTTVTYHGASDAYARRMQVLVDGRAVYTPAFGGVLWSDLPLALEDIERIEVIRGPNGVTYGANAFAATVNIITRHPEMDRGTFLKYTYGDIETRQGLVRHGGGGEGFPYRLTLGYREDAGFVNTEDGQRVSLLTFRGDYRASDRDEVDIQFGYNGGPRGEGKQNSTADPVREKQITSHFQQIRWKHTVTADEDLGLQFYHNYHRSSDTYSVPLFSPMIEDLLSERFNLELQHTFRAREDTRVVWGAEARRDIVGGQGWFGTSSRLQSELFRLFANAEWRLAPAWILNAGAMYEHNDITGGDVSPRLGINHHLTRHDTVRAILSRAYRTPSLFEHKADTNIRLADGTLYNRLYKSDIQLKPERIDSLELGYLGEFPEPGLLLDLKIYREEIHDTIVAVTDSSTVPGDSYAVFRNNGYSDTNGAEMQWTFQAGPRTQMIYAHAYAHQRGRTLETLPNTYVSTYQSTPVHTRSLLARHGFTQRLEGSFGYYKISNIKFLGGDNTGDYNTLDMRFAYKLRWGATRGEVSVVGQHLTGDYFDFDEAIVFDKRFFVNLSLEFK